MSSQLPLELFDEIISYLWDDRNALRSCSLAGRILIVTSQKVLFYQIILNPTSRDHGSGTSAAFHKLLETSPHIADYVQCLQIYEIDELDGYSDWPADCWLPNDPFLPLFSPLLSNLKVLVVRHVPDWNFLCDQVRHSLQNLIRLPSLVHIDLSTLPAILLHQSNFSHNLKHLIIHSNYFLRPNLMPPKPSSYYPPIYLETLVLERTAQPFLIPLTSDPDFRLKTSHLRVLILHHHSTDETFDWVGIWPLLYSCRETLEQFTFMPSIVTRSQTAVRTTPRSTSIDLSQMTALKTFTLSLLGINVWDPLWCFDTLLKSASSICQQLEDITLVLEKTLGNSFTDLRCWNESCADFLLNPRRCPRLRKLTIHATESYGNNQLLAALENSESMEKLRARMEVVTDSVGLSIKVGLPDERWGNIEFV